MRVSEREREREKERGGGVGKGAGATKKKHNCICSRSLPAFEGLFLGIKGLGGHYSPKKLAFPLLNSDPQASRHGQCERVSVGAAPCLALRLWAQRHCSSRRGEVCGIARACLKNGELRRNKKAKRKKTRTPQHNTAHARMHTHAKTC